MRLLHAMRLDLAALVAGSGRQLLFLVLLGCVVMPAATGDVSLAFAGGALIAILALQQLLGICELDSLETLHAVLPVPRRTLVAGRHAAAIAIWVGASLLALTVASTRSAMNASPPSLSQITLAAAASATGMAMMLVATLPVCYLLGYTRGRFLVFVPMFIAFALVPLATQLGAGSLIATLWPHVMRVFTPAALCGLAIALTALSIVLSTAAATTPRRRQRPTGSRRSATRLL